MVEGRPVGSWLGLVDLSQVGQAVPDRITFSDIEDQVGEPDFRCEDSTDESRQHIPSGTA